MKKKIILYALAVVLLTVAIAFVSPHFFTEEQTAQKNNTASHQTVADGSAEKTEPQVVMETAVDLSDGSENNAAMASAHKGEMQQPAQSTPQIPAVALPSANETQQSSSDNAIVELFNETDEVPAEDTATEPSKDPERLQIKDITDILPRFGIALPTTGSDGYYNAVIKP